MTIDTIKNIKAMGRLYIVVELLFMRPASWAKKFGRWTYKICCHESNNVCRLYVGWQQVGMGHVLYSHATCKSQQSESCGTVFSLNENNIEVHLHNKQS